MFVFQPPFSSGPPKPTIIIVTGKILHHIAYSTLAESLPSTGHRVLAPELASDWSFKPLGETVEVDVEALRNNILQQVNAGNEVVLVMHSYGCIVGGAAVKGLSKKQREAEGEKGGVVGLIFIAGFLVDGGMSVKDTLPGGSLESTEEYPIGEPIQSGHTTNLQDLRRQLYSTETVPESSYRANFKKILADGKLCFVSPSPAQGWKDDGFHGRRAYIRASKDTCLPLPEQTAMIEGSGVEWMIEDLDAGYNICKTHTDALVELIPELIFGFEAAE
ncbi:hypothetical protein B0J11DRAFT_506776 [Dendryphion nanum]|uniref:AB hydrolase-1 domain-containing protein n=1 Tax=Dendryphion nanum TaxID=256645 RepID=A0A9P9DRI8_9PLEO|nr:hypothetical protein B0J11DRAFT_506776 [Dendryphion nanum]